jgi:DNA-binding LacI/PurR family transcriptional regulator
VSLGRRRLAFLGHATTHYPEFFDRYRGYERALLEGRIATDSALQVDAITTEEAGFQAAKELLSRGVEFDAIVAASDLIAIGALRALQESGIDVPKQVSVVGFDDIPAASLTNPPLTTVMQDTRRAGELLVEALLRQIAGDAASNQVIPTKLVVRKSA